MIINISENWILQHCLKIPLSIRIIKTLYNLSLKLPVVSSLLCERFDGYWIHRLAKVVIYLFENLDHLVFTFYVERLNESVRVVWVGFWVRLMYHIFIFHTIYILGFWRFWLLHYGLIIILFFFFWFNDLYLWIGLFITVALIEYLISVIHYDIIEERVKFCLLFWEVDFFVI